MKRRKRKKERKTVATVNNRVHMKTDLRVKKGKENHEINNHSKKKNLKKKKDNV